MGEGREQFLPSFLSLSGQFSLDVRLTQLDL